jgi:hypothetical protein
MIPSRLAPEKFAPQGNYVATIFPSTEEGIHEVFFVRSKTLPDLSNQARLKRVSGHIELLVS